MLSIEVELKERLIGAGDTTVTCVTPVDITMTDIDVSEYRNMTANTPLLIDVCPPPSPIGSDGMPQFWCEIENMWFAQGPVEVYESEECPHDDGESMGMRKRARFE